MERNKHILENCSIQRYGGQFKRQPGDGQNRWKPFYDKNRSLFKQRYTKTRPLRATFGRHPNNRADSLIGIPNQSGKCTRAEKRVSWGIILVQNKKVLLITRKNSLGLTELVKGRYNPYNFAYVADLVSQMMDYEIDFLMANIDNFRALWDKFWTKRIYFRGRDPFPNAKYKFDIIQERLKDYLHRGQAPLFKTQEIGFPKGKREHNESGLDCALREFTEETGFTKEQIRITNKNVIIEKCDGTDGILYTHCYFLAESDDLVPDKSRGDGEVGSINFYSAEECESLIDNNSVRYYHKDKIRIIRQVLNTQKE